MQLNFCEDNIESYLNSAILNDNIVAYYQPKYDALTRKITGAEALARWFDTDGTVISPASFVPLLEKSSLITRLDWHILNKVCSFFQNHRDDYDALPISVNFSRMHTYEADFVQKLCSIVDSYNIERRLIEVEITESALTDGKDIIDFVTEIRNAGFSIAIDDFGSGLSSLNFVKDVPANVIKIDKSLLSGNCEDEKERVVLESIFTFAKRLKLTSVAEGVETKEQLGFLRTCGCEVIQGFYFAKPMPEDSYATLLEDATFDHETEDIIITQPTASATQLLLDAVFMCYPLVIMSNLSRNSFYMMVYDNFTTRSCPSTGVYTELIEHGASTMHPEDMELFRRTFNLKEQLAAYSIGQRTRSVVTRQRGDDGVYRAVETTNYYVQNPASDDVLAITLSKPLL
jgi:EAL domain-containing protein (putative c-di-GMP-specific phosphodiesterase class I)